MPQDQEEPQGREVLKGQEERQVPEEQQVQVAPPMSQQYIELNRFLKLCGLAQSGGEAKRLVDEGMVFVNGEPESRRRRKLRRGDKVSLDGEIESVDDYVELEA